MQAAQPCPRNQWETGIDEGVVQYVYRWARKMEDEEIAPNTYIPTADPVESGFRNPLSKSTYQ